MKVKLKFKFMASWRIRKASSSEMAGKECFFFFFSSKSSGY